MSIFKTPYFVGEEMHSWFEGRLTDEILVLVIVRHELLLLLSKLKNEKILKYLQKVQLIN